MGKRILSLVAITALVMIAALFAAPSTGQASPITITSICAKVGNTAWGSVGVTAGQCGGTAVPVANQIWDLSSLPDGGGAGVTLGAGNTLVLTQTAAPGAGGFSFDSSEGNNLPACGAPPCATALFVNGGAIALVPGQDTNSVLANGNADPGGPLHNEATNWTVATAPTAILGEARAYFGYADNVHNNACADTDGNCLPNGGGAGFPFDFWLAGTPTTFFLGDGASFPGGGGPNANHCTGVRDCFDAGAILIRNNQSSVPEPASLLLLGTGLIGLAAWGQKRNRDRR